MENPSSPLDTLRQLKEMLDAGALTPAEFEALKQRLVIGPGTAAPAAEAAAGFGEPAPEPPAFGRPGSFDSALPPPAADAWVFEPAPEPRFTSAAAPDSGDNETETPADEEAADFVGPPAERNSSLGLLLAIGAVLVFLAVVAYLGFTRPASEHISSTSQTAADSVDTAIETGPQVAPLPANTATPETIRVAPTNPAPIIQPRPAAPVADSAAPATNAPIADSTFD